MEKKSFYAKTNSALMTIWAFLAIVMLVSDGEPHIIVLIAIVSTPFLGITLMLIHYVRNKLKK